MTLSEYIEEVIEEIYKVSKEKYIRAQVFQDFETAAQISKKLLKCKEQKILLVQRFEDKLTEESKRACYSQDVFKIPASQD